MSTSKMERNSKALVESLFEEIDSLKNGTSTYQQARAKAALANTICNVTRLEIDYARFVAAGRADDKNIGPKALTWNG